MANRFQGFSGVGTTDANLKSQLFDARARRNKDSDEEDSEDDDSESEDEESKEDVLQAVPPRPPPARARSRGAAVNYADPPDF